MEFHLWLSLATICILGAMSPGPSLALVVKNTINGGVNQGYITSISHGLGVMLYAIFTMTGIGIILVSSPTLFMVIQYTGAIFLVYLGIKALFNTRNPLHITTTPEHKISINSWRDGFLIAFLNPKLAIFFLALFSQFVDADAHWQQKLMMTATVGGIDIIWYMIVAYGLSRGNLLAKLKAHSGLVDKLTGCFLILLAARVVWN